MSERRPNVILITCDQLRGDALHCAGAGFMHTPNLDALAASGVRFERACASNPICVPARATFTTGNPSHICTGNKNNWGQIRDDQPKIAQHFADNGYRTYALGKLHYVPYVNPRLEHGFHTVEICEEGRAIRQRLNKDPDLWNEEYDDYLKSVGWGGYQRAHGIGNNDVHAGPSPLPEEHYVDTWVMSRSLHYIEAHRREHPDKPFFMWTSFIKPHSPYDPPEPFNRFYDPREIPPPAGGPEDLADRDRILSLWRAGYGWDRMGPEGVQYSRAHYFGLVTFLDKQVGRLLRYLDANGLREETVILFSADHGDHMGDHGIFFKSTFMNGSVHIPCIFSAPGQGVPAGQVRDHLAGTEDALPTLCDLAGVPIPAGICGRSLRPVLNDAGAEHRDYYVSQTGGPPRQSYMVFDGRWKYIYNEVDGLEQLYDDAEDPEELHNVAADLAPRVTEMRDILVAWCREHADETMFDKDGRLIRSDFDPERDSFLPHERLGWRPY